MGGGDVTTKRRTYVESSVTRGLPVIKKIKTQQQQQRRCPKEILQMRRRRWEAGPAASAPWTVRPWNAGLLAPARGIFFSPCSFFTIFAVPRGGSEIASPGVGSLLLPGAQPLEAVSIPSPGKALLGGLGFQLLLLRQCSLVQLVKCCVLERATWAHARGARPAGRPRAPLFQIGFVPEGAATGTQEMPHPVSP